MSNENGLGTSADRSDQLLIIISLMLVGASIYLGGNFYNPDNFRTLMTTFVPIGFISIGMMALLICGVFDLSVGSIYAVGVISVAYFLDSGMAWPLAIVVTLVLCIMCGAFNGFLVTVMKINPLIATLGTMGILRGLAHIIGSSRDATVQINLPESFTALGESSFLGLGLPVWLFFITGLLFMFMFRYLKFFRKFYFVGSNKDAARLCGIKTDWIWFNGFVIMSLLAGVAGVLYCARIGAATPQAGLGMELHAIAGVVIGGASLNGGKGTILGGILGALFMALVFNIMNIAGVSGFWQLIVNGTILILAVYTDVIGEEGYFSKIFNKGQKV